MNVDLKKWMSIIPNGTPLATLSIPGTHQSPSLHNHHLKSDTAKCQNLNIKQQLEIGVRFFDVRLKKINNKTLQAWHGSGTAAKGYIELGVDQQTNFREIQQECINFLTSNARETIFICFGREDGDDIAPLLYSKFDQNYWKFPETFPTTISTGIRGKIILIKRYTDYTSKDLGMVVGYSNSKERLFIQGLTDKFRLNKEFAYNWNNKYHNLNLVTVNNKCYISGQNSSKRFFTQAIDKRTGHIAPEEAYAENLDVYYPTMCSLDVGGKTYIAAQANDENHTFFIREVETNGKLGTKHKYTDLSSYCESMCSLQVGGKTYIARQTTQENNKLFIQEVIEGGELGNIKTSKDCDTFYNQLYAVKIGGKTFLIQHSTTNNAFLIQEILSEGKLGDKTEDKLWVHYHTLCPFQFGGKTYLARLSNANKYNLYINEITREGKLGEQVFTEEWNNYYERLMFFNRLTPVKTLGINLSEGWSNNNKDFKINLPNNTTLQIQDEYQPSGGASESPNHKYNRTIEMLGKSSSNESNSLYTINFASGIYMKTIDTAMGNIEFPSIKDPMANHVNPRLKAYLQDNKKCKTGFLLFDYINEELSRLVIETTYKNVLTD